MIKQESIEKNRLEFLCANIPLAVGTVFCAILVIFALFHEIIEPVTFYSWIVMGLLVCIARLWSYFWIKERLNTPAAYARINHIIIATSLSTGLLWGVGSVFFSLESDIFYWVFWVAVLVGFAAAAANSMSASMSAFSAYFLPTLVPITVFLFFQDDERTILMGALLIVFTAAVWSIARNSHKMLSKNFSQTTQMAAALEDLEAENKIRKQMEKNFIQSQKMEAIGGLVGGIAHNFNNNLAGVTGNIELARLELDNKQVCLDYLDESEVIAFRSAEMIQQLLSFARKSSTLFKPVAIDGLMRSIIKLDKVVIPQHIKLVFHSGLTDETILGDANQIQQMVMNLLLNANYALKDKKLPAITVTVSRYEPDAKFQAKHPQLEEDHFVLISIADNGSGINEENLPHIFEPFFTTREVGEGTGLGLSMLYGSMQSHGGAVEVDSRKGEGAVFNLYFPLLDSPPVEVSAGKSSNVFGKGELILVVDDDEQVIKVVCALLEKLNYRVLTAIGGQQAIDIYLDKKDEISLIMLDVIMPGIDGIEAEQQIHCINPQAKVLFMSGYRNVSSMPEQELEPILTKPFHLSELSRCVSSMINEPGDSLSFED